MTLILLSMNVFLFPATHLKIYIEREDVKYSYTDFADKVDRVSQPPKKEKLDIWFSPRQAVVKGESYCFIIHKISKTLTIIYPKQKSYFKTILPLAYERVLPRNQLRPFKLKSYYLNIHPQKEETTFHQRPCRLTTIQMGSILDRRITLNLWISQEKNSFSPFLPTLAQLAYPSILFTPPMRTKISTLSGLILKADLEIMYMPLAKPIRHHLKVTQITQSDFPALPDPEGEKYNLLKFPSMD